MKRAACKAALFINALILLIDYTGIIVPYAVLLFNDKQFMQCPRRGYIQELCKLWVVLVAF